VYLLLFRDSFTILDYKGNELYNVLYCNIISLIILNTKNSLKIYCKNAEGTHDFTFHTYKNTDDKLSIKSYICNHLPKDYKIVTDNSYATLRYNIKPHFCKNAIKT
jgi:hypothetical protein